MPIDPVEKEFMWWKNRAALLKSADLKNTQMRNSLATVMYRTYCSSVKNDAIHDASVINVENFEKSIMEMDRDGALECIKKGLSDFRNLLPDSEKTKVKVEEI